MQPRGMWSSSGSLPDVHLVLLCEGLTYNFILFEGIVSPNCLPIVVDSKTKVLALGSQICNHHRSTYWECPCVMKAQSSLIRMKTM